MDARLREGIDLFNAGRFFDSHEIWESLYLEAEEQIKPFLEGLIQLAAAFRLVNEFAETKGAVRMIRQALIRLERYQPIFLEVRVKELSESLESWAKEADATSGKAPSSIPSIRLI